MNEEYLIADLNESFEKACETYKLALSSRTSNRAKKELSRGNSKGTNIYKFQVNFSWILHDIRCGPICFIDDREADARSLIDHIYSISET